MTISKDYYRILNVKSSASANEIKNAYRRLAMKYHPDKNPGDALAAAVFTDVAEAYGILSDDISRKQYNNKRYVTATQEYKKPIEAIEVLIDRIDAINKQIKNINQFHLNKDALLYTLMQLFPEDVGLLCYTNNKLLDTFLEKVLITSAYLSSSQTKQLIFLLQPLYEKNNRFHQNMQKLLKQQEQNERWEKYKIILAIAAAIILCILIFVVTKK